MNSLLTSQLYDHTTFYRAFENDLKRAHHSVLIESPFMTERRMNELLPLLSRLGKRGVRMLVNTCCPAEHKMEYRRQAVSAIRDMQRLGVTVLYTGKHHRKLAIIDREILWEGSLNILSQCDSCEVMRRIDSKELARQMVTFVGLNGYML